MNCILIFFLIIVFSDALYLHKEEIDKRQISSILQSMETTSVMRCAKLCARHGLCIGINSKIHSTAQRHISCELLGVIDSGALSEEDGWNVFIVFRGGVFYDDFS